MFFGGVVQVELRNKMVILGVSSSYVWRSIFESQAVIKQGCRRRIGDGKDTKVWQVPWLPCVNNGYLTSDVYPELKDVTVDSFFDADSRNWDANMLNDLCNERDRALVYQVPIPMRSKNDSWFWLPESKGEFSVRSCYRLLWVNNSARRENFEIGYGAYDYQERYQIFCEGCQETCFLQQPVCLTNMWI